jgi:hypothetical protein
MAKSCQGGRGKEKTRIRFYVNYLKNRDVETFEKFLEQNVESVRNFRITFSFFVEIFKLKKMI